MYPMMGPGYGCQMVSFPPLVTPAMPAATAVISARGASLSSPIQQYSNHQFPLSGAAPVVPLYMSPVIGPFMQPGSSSNLAPFIPSLPHAAVQSQQSAAALVLRPSMMPAHQLYTVNCVLAAQQQQVKSVVV